MTCTDCGRYAPPDPETGYDADEVCPDCLALRDVAEADAYDAEMLTPEGPPDES